VVNVELTREAWQETLVQRHGQQLQKAFSDATVAICGLGGLGSNIAIALARAGIGKLVLADFDRVDISNLHRQQYTAAQEGMRKTDALKASLTEIAPYMEVEAHSARITEQNAVELLQQADMICEAFDDAEAEAMLTEIVLEKMPDKYLIAASGMAGLGSGNAIKTRKITNRFYLCGDESSDVQTEGTLFSARVMLCAAHQALTVLRILAGEFET